VLDSRVAEVEHGEAQEADVVDSHPEVEARPEAEVDLEAIVVVAAGSLDLVVSLAVVVLREDEAAAGTSGENEYEALAQAFVGSSVVERSLWRLCPVSDYGARKASAKSCVYFIQSLFQNAVRYADI
jgi:hypothetical protein